MTSDEGRASFDPALFPVRNFLFAARRLRKSGDIVPRAVITGIDRLWRAPDNGAPETQALET